MDFLPIVLCAGFGTRLRPLTNYLPKTVAPVAGWPVAYHSIRELLRRGAPVVHCNTHYLAPIIESELRAALQRDGFDAQRIRFWHEDQILETGGGITRIVQTLHAENPDQVIDKGILVIAGDVYAEAPIDQMIRRWRERPPGTAALMCTRTLRTARPDVTWVDRERDEVVGFGKDIIHPEPRHESRLFSTHQIVAAEVVLGAQVIKESSRDLFYRASLSKGLRILNVDYPEEATWHDIGDYSALARCIETSRLGTINLPKQCLIMLSEGDLVDKNSSGRSHPAGQKSSGDFFRGFSSLCHPDQENQTPESPSLPSRLSSSFTLARVILDSGLGIVSPLASEPVLAEGVLFGESARRLQKHCAYSPQSGQVEFPLPRDPGNPALFFSLRGAGLPGPHPLLVPLELLELPLPLDPAQPLVPLYQSSRTFFLFL